MRRCDCFGIKFIHSSVDYHFHDVLHLCEGLVQRESIDFIHLSGNNVWKI